MSVPEAYLYGGNAVYLEELFHVYRQSPEAVDPEWRSFFDSMGGRTAAGEKAVTHLRVIGAPEEAAPAPAGKGGSGKPGAVAAKPVPANAAAAGVSSAELERACLDSINALMLIRAYKVRGHLLANLDPLGLTGKIEHPDLDPGTYGFSAADLSRSIFLGGALGYARATLQELIDRLRRDYSGSIGVEFMHLPALEERDWIADKMQDMRRFSLSKEDKRSTLSDIIQVQEFEQFLHRRFPGQKRFSAEGGESVFAAIEKAIEAAAKAGVEEAVIGMPHRGRLNVLTKVMGKPYAALLAEFRGEQTHFSLDLDATGDVKYHQGVSTDRQFDGKHIHLSLAANPSHLEAVNPVVEGRVRAKQDQREDHARRRVLPILLHGDAAFAGQGVVAETLALSDLDGYTTGGTLHFIVNNQIGFTTNPSSARKSPYPADIAKGVHAPIFHVNGDDPEAVVYVSLIALEYRQRFGKDAVVDVFCYRRYGHNEGDEPFFTQPIMYTAIAKHPTPTEVYGARLIQEGVITQEQLDREREEVSARFASEYEKSMDYPAHKPDRFGGFWSDLVAPGEQDLFRPAETGVSDRDFERLAAKLCALPENFEVNPKLIRRNGAMRESVATGRDFDWAFGEALAFATLLDEGFPVRLAGQDAVRGTFSHRHSAYTDQRDERRFFPLKHLREGQARFEVLDSNLSEYAALGFEYGYSITAPNTLSIWEAQFGDFVNGAQIIIDQFISSAETKWLRSSGIVMLLPHGYEGQGPEHSSARPERFLQMCAENNMQVVNITTPANFFHALRRQLHRPFRKPLIVMSPKSLLRHKDCVSVKADFVEGSHFQEVIDDAAFRGREAEATKVVFCTGKIYYELAEAVTARGILDTAVIRVEQLYPFPKDRLAEISAAYVNARFVWCQEEPGNMGAWHYIDRRLEDMLTAAGHAGKRPSYAGRPDNAAPAVGYTKKHVARQKAVIDDALA